MAWTQWSPDGSDIQVAQWDTATATWVALGSSLDVGGISGTGTADGAPVVFTPAGTVVAWIDRSGGTPRVQVKGFANGVWTDLSSGLSAAAGGAQDLTLAADGNHIAIAWTTTVAGVQQVHLRERRDGTWIELGQSASGGGLSNTSDHSRAPTLAYHNGQLFAAWQTFVDMHWEIYASRFNDGAWQPAGTGATSGRGVSSTVGQASMPQLASSGGRLHLLWVDDLTQSGRGVRTALYGKVWNGSRFAAELPGDAEYDGLNHTGDRVHALAAAVDQAGHPIVAWQDAASGDAEVYVRADRTTIYQVRSGPSVQAILNQYDLGPGDVIQLAPGRYGGFTIDAQDAGVTIVGPADGVAEVFGSIIVGAHGVTLEGLEISGSISAANVTNLTVHRNMISGGVTLTEATSPHILANSLQVGGVQLDAATDLLLVGNSISVADEQTGIDLASASSGVIRGNTVSGGTGLRIAAEFAGPIERNVFERGSVGVIYAAPAALDGNEIRNNTVGIQASVNTLSGGLGYVGSAAPNDIHHNVDGVELTGRMQGQRIHDNVTGVTGSGTLGGEDFATANLIEQNLVGVQFDGTVQFNRIAQRRGRVCHQQPVDSP